MMRISEAAKQSGLTQKAIRYYEKAGLIDSVRLANRYRDYSSGDVDAMRFLHHARDLGFSVDLCKDLLLLYKNPNRASKNVKAIAKKRADDIDKQVDQLLAMKKILTDLIEICPGDANPKCTILDELAK